MRRPTLAFAAVFMAGCIGGEARTPSSDTPEIGEEEQPVETVEDCESPAVADALPLRRLSAAQYRWTLYDFLVSIGAEEDDVLNWFLDEVWMPLQPPDVVTGAEGQIRGGFRRLDQDVHQQHVEGYLVAAQ
ncbi:MAG: hypothetical protein AAFV53_12500, partial [Myxococcota bacterium]